MGNNGNSDRLYFLGLQNHCGGYYSCEIKFGRKAMTNRQHIKKQRHYFANKGPSSQSYDFSSSHVWMWGLAYREGWVPKNWCFWMWYWIRLLRVPWAARRSNQSILKKSILNIRGKDWCWSWNSNTLAIWFEEPSHWKRPWCWEGLKAKGEGDDRGWDGWMASPARWTWVWASSGSWDGQGSLACCSPWGRKESDTTEWLNWTDWIE